LSKKSTSTGVGVAHIWDRIFCLSFLEGMVFKCSKFTSVVYFI
jgi:hypothetical protein